MSGIPLDRLSRTLRLQRLLADGVSVTEAASRLRVSRRTIHRDIGELTKLSLVPGDPSNSVRIRETELTSEECRELFLLLDKMSDHRTIPGFGFVGAASTKLKEGLPPTTQAEIAERNQSVTFADPPLSQEKRAAAFFQSCSDALRQLRVLRVRYDSVFDDAHLAIDLQIYHLTFRHRSWYAIAHSSFHDAVRTFHLGRLISTELLNDQYRVPNDFTPEGYFGNAWQMIRGDREFDVRVRFSPLVARSVADVRWHRTQTTTWLDDGSLVFTARVAGLSEIASWVLGYGTQAEVLEPTELRHQLSERVYAISRYYRPEEPPHQEI